MIAAIPPTSAHRVSAIIPCLNEEEAIGAVVRAVLDQGVGEVIVVDGNSEDRTAERARAAGARVIVEPRRGYGRAMLTGVSAIDPAAEIVLFVDGDGSDRPELISSVLEPIRSGTAHFVLGSRLKGERESGSLSLPQIVAGHLAGLLIRLFYGVRFTDMSPFRAIRRDALESLGMQEESFGWNLEMQMRAAAAGLRIVEIPVGQRRRAGGASKVSGNLSVAIKVAWVLSTTFVRLARTLRRSGPSAVEPRHPALTGERPKGLTAQKPVEAETLAGVVQQEEALDEDEEDKEPRPLVRVVIEAEPKVSGLQHSEHGHRPHEEAEEKRDSERQFEQEDQRVDQWQEGQEDIGRDPAMPTEGGEVRELSRPKLEGFGHRQR